MPVFSLSLQLYLVDSKPPEKDVVVNQNGVLIRSEYEEGSSSRKKLILQSRSIAVFKLKMRSLSNWQLPRDLSETNRFISCCISVHL